MALLNNTLFLWIYRTHLILNHGKDYQHVFCMSIDIDFSGKILTALADWKYHRDRVGLWNRFEIQLAAMNGGWCWNFTALRKNEFSQGSLGGLNFVNWYTNREKDKINSRKIFDIEKKILKWGRNEKESCFWWFSASCIVYGFSSFHMNWVPGYI